MKVTCEYCGSYVDTDQNGNCPCCQAPLGETVRAEEERLQQEEEAKRQKEAQEQAEQAKQEKISSTIKGIASAAGALLLGGTRNRVHRGSPAPPSASPPRRGMPPEPPRSGRDRRPPEDQGRHPSPSPGRSGGPGDRDARRSPGRH